MIQKFGTSTHTHTDTHTRGLSSSSNKHGRRHEAVPAVDGEALVIVQLGAACAHVGGRDFAVGGVIPTGGGRGVIMCPLCSTILLVVGIKVLQATRQP